MSDESHLDRHCPHCRTTKPSTEFYKRPDGKPAGYCKKCHNDRAKEKLKDPIEKARKNARHRQWRKKRRQTSNPRAIARVVLNDCKSSDQKRARANDLDFDFVLSVVSKPCTYCAETLLRMTLDRIDNAIGHTRANVVGACIRCNYTRGPMPYAAWLLVAKGMKEAREAGAFGDWKGRYC